MYNTCWCQIAAAHRGWRRWTLFLRHASKLFICGAKRQFFTSEWESLLDHS